MHQLLGPRTPPVLPRRPQNLPAPGNQAAPEPPRPRLNTEPAMAMLPGMRIVQEEASRGRTNTAGNFANHGHSAANLQIPSPPPRGISPGRRVSPGRSETSSHDTPPGSPGFVRMISEDSPRVPPRHIPTNSIAEAVAAIQAPDSHVMPEIVEPTPSDDICECSPPRLVAC